MKRWIAVCLLLCVGLVLSACGGEADHSGPPIVPPIESALDFEEFLDSAMLSDAELEAFLTEHPYESRSIRTREDVETLTKPFYDVGFPALQDASVTHEISLQCFPEESRFALTYQIDGIMYSFQYTNYSDKTNRVGMIPVKTVDLAVGSVALYQGAKGLVGEIYSGDYQIRLAVKGYSDVDEIDFEQFAWEYPTLSDSVS